MKKKLNILTMSYFLFLFLLFLSGLFSGIISEVVYYLSFLIPIGISLFLTRDDPEDPKRFLTINAEGVKLSAPLLFPTISVTILISYVTSLIIFALTGKTNSVDLGDSYILALITHALVPAVFEEALFRYIPMRLLSSHSPRCTIIVSALFFSLVHGDLFTIPYAFFGGIMFMAIDLASESIIPSVIIHFINNAISVSMMFASLDSTVFLVYLSIGILTLESLILIWKNRHEYDIPLMLIFDKGEGVKFTPSMIFFALITLALAVLNLL